MAEDLPEGLKLSLRGLDFRLVPVQGKRERNTVAYVPCYACGYQHKNIPQREIVQVLIQFQEGFGQHVTPHGVESRCILDILGIPATQRKEREGGSKVGQKNGSIAVGLSV